MNQTNKRSQKVEMNTRHSWNYFWKRAFTKKSTWIILLLHLVIVSFLFLIFKKDSWPLGKQRVEWETKEEIGGERDMPKYGGYQEINPKVSSVNDFLACVFPNLIVPPLVILTYVFSPLSWIFWGQFDDIGQKTQTDGTDLFFLATEIPTSRKRIFYGKLTFLTGFFSVLYLISFALPLSFLWWKTNYFSNFTGLQTFLFLACNFLIVPLLFFVPLVIFLFSLASLNSIWYTILKWFGRLSVIFIMLVGFLVFRALYRGGGIGEKILEWGKDFSQWLSQNYLLTILTLMGVIIGLALFTLSLAYKNFQKKDLQ